jgi:hypothetical protein
MIVGMMMPMQTSISRLFPALPTTVLNLCSKQYSRSIFFQQGNRWIQHDLPSLPLNFEIHAAKEETASEHQQKIAQNGTTAKSSVNKCSQPIIACGPQSRCQNGDGQRPPSLIESLKRCGTG